jgi:DNA-binding response OmpR family regulator
MASRVLIVEDNRDIARVLRLHLSDAGHGVEVAHDGQLGLELAAQGGFDLVLLDVMLPKIDGLEVCRRLRATQSYVPILMLTSKASELDRVLGLEIGADDYLAKPFSIQELLARVKAILRRVERLQGPAPEGEAHALHCGDLRIDVERRAVTASGRAVDLTAKEFELLTFFARHPGRVYTRAQLLDQVWGYGHDGYEHTVNSHINRLRAKIENDPADPRYVLTVWGVGYKFAEARPSGAGPSR